MKKSEMYRLAQKAVVNSLCIDAGTKLDILKVLMEDENIAKYTEAREEKAREEKANEAV